MAISTGIIKIGKNVVSQVNRTSRVIPEVTPAIKELASDTVELSAKKAKNATKDLPLNFFQRARESLKMFFSIVKLAKTMLDVSIKAQQKAPKNFWDKVINKVKYPIDLVKVIRNNLKQIKTYEQKLIKELPERRKKAQELIDSIDDKTWEKMSRAIFRNSAHTNTPFVKKLKSLRAFCKKNNIELSDDVAKSIQILSKRGKLFAQKMNEALSKGLNPQNQGKYTQKFVKINQKEFDTIKKFIESLPPEAQVQFKSLYNFETMSSKMLYDERIYQVSNNVIKRNQTFYHGTKSQEKILKNGFSSTSGQAVAAREIGEAVYLTPKKRVASFFAGLKGSILKLRVNTKKVAAINDAQQTKIIEEIMGNSGLSIEDTTNPLVKELLIKNLFTRNGYNAVYASRALTPNTDSILQPLITGNQSIVNAVTGGKQSQLAVFDPKDITILRKTMKEKIKDTVTQISTFIKSPFITFKSIKQSIKGFTKTLNNKDG